MRIIQMPSGLSSFLAYSVNSKLHISLTQADLCMDGENIRISRYGEPLIERRQFVYEGITYRFIGSDLTSIEYQALRKAELTVIDVNGNSPNQIPEILDLLISCSSSKNRERVIKGNKIIGVIFDYDANREKEDVFMIADIQTQECNFMSSRGVTNELLCEKSILYFDRRRRNLKCLDHALKENWKFKPDQKILPTYVSGPEIYGDLVIHSFGPSRLECAPGPVYMGEQQADKRLHYDTQLYALSLSDGSVCWHITIPKTIDNMVIVEDKLYLSSTNEIHVINPNSGKTEQVIETGLSEDYDHSYEKSSLHIQDNKLYFCHQADACVMVYNLDGLDLLRRIDIPKPHTIREFEYFHKETGKLYFNLTSQFPSLYYHRNPVLEIDPADLDSKIEMVNGPDVDIKLLPSEENSAEKEIWITICNVSLDEAMAYAEMHTENQAFYHGTHGAFATLHKTDEFNGKVHFRYSGSDKPTQEVNEKLKILERRFEEWADTNAFASTDPSQNATLETKYLE